MTTAENFIYLSGCAINGNTAVLKSIDFEALWALAKKHLMTALIAKALMSTEAFRSADAQEQSRWTTAYNNSVKKTMLFDAERKRILKFLDDNGIWYVPLKGAIINRLYRHYGTREFSDNDILFDETYTQTTRDYMASLGYERKTEDLTADEYVRPPVYNFELHPTLFTETTEHKKLYEHYSHIFERLIKDDGNRCGYHMTDEDFYIYFVAHAYKHYEYMGTGFRTVIDAYAILNAEQFHLDFDKIDKETKQLGISEFEHTLRALATHLLSDPEALEASLENLNDSESEMLRFILSNAVFGTLETLITKKYQAQENNSKGKYYLRRIFPSVSKYQYTHPFVYKHKIVYPFFWVYRLATYPFKHRKYLKQEYEAIQKINNKND